LETVKAHQKKVFSKGGTNVLTSTLPAANESTHKTSADQDQSAKI
jgi:hypothetical protein